MSVVSTPNASFCIQMGGRSKIHVTRIGKESMRTLTRRGIAYDRSTRFFSQNANVKAVIYNRKQEPLLIHAGLTRNSISTHNVSTCEAADDDHSTSLKSHATINYMFSLLCAPLCLVSRELFLSYRFVHYDLSTTVIPGFILTFVMSLKGTPATTLMWKGLCSSLVWMWLYIYVFTLANQIEGVKEDALNKPTRPIPSGDVTLQGAKVRLGLVIPLFLGLGCGLGIGWWTAMWILCVLVHNFTNFSTGWWHWLSKPIVMGIGAFVLCVGNIGLVRAVDSNALLYSSAISMGIALSSSLQDLRDIKGDKGQQRKTLPILLGDDPARHLCNFFLLLFWGIMHLALTTVAGTNLKSLLTSGVILTWCAVLWFRQLFKRTAIADHDSYMIYTYLFCFILSSPMWIL